MKQKGAKARARPKTPKRTKGSRPRDVLFRPDRMKYIKGEKDQKPKGFDCVFCEALSGGVSPQTLILWRSEDLMVVMNKFPYNPGHLLILPTRHEADLLNLELATTSQMMWLLRKSLEILRNTLNPQDFNIGMNLGRGAGAGIPEHLHLHIVPRWPGDTNFFAVIAESKVIPADLEGVYRLLQPHFQNLERVTS